MIYIYIHALITSVTSRLFKLSDVAIPSAMPDFERARTPAFIAFIVFSAFFGCMA